MRFRELKRFFGGGGEAVSKWVEKELNSVLRELYIGLTKLSFGDNFLSQEWEGEILPGKEQAISHNLKSIPTRFLILCPTGNALLIHGDTSATEKVFYVKNVGTTTTFKGKVIIFP